MVHRLAKTVVAALALVVVVAPAAAALGAATPAGGSEPKAAVAESRQQIEVPGWLVWLRSIVLGEGSSTGDASGPPAEAGDGESDSDVGPSLDPNG